MKLDQILSRIFKIWRAKRMIQFEQLLNPQSNNFVLDVGGYPRSWLTRPQLTKRVDCLNIHPINWDRDSSAEHNIVTVVGNGCSLEYSDGSYDILFSNSVIEHVGDWNCQCQFANEARRVGKKLWIQTPAFECPLESHFLAPFVHWLPVSISRKIIRWFTLWGWLTKPSQSKIDEMIKSIRLLTKAEMKELFPDCEILTERLLGIFPKSYIAYRTNSEQGSGDKHCS